MKRYPKSAFMWLPFAFALGAVVGGWSSSEKLRRVSAEPPVEKPPVANAGGMDVITKALNLPDRAEKRERPRRVGNPRPESAGAEKPAAVKVEIGDRGGVRAPEDLSLRIEEAKELWRTRSAVAREAAISDFGLTEEGAAVFDAAVAKMNEHVGEIIAAIAGEIGEDGKFTPELGARAMGELGIAFTEAYDGIAECLDPSQRARLSELSLTDFIDPSVADPLIPVHEKFRSGMKGMRRTGASR